MNKEQAKILINDLGKNRQPFLFIIDFEIDNTLVYNLNEVDTNKIKYSFNKLSNYKKKKISKKLEFSAGSLNFNNYKNSFDIVKRNILLGNSYLVNLTSETKIYTNYSLLELFYKSSAKYKLYYNDEFVFFSPEIFVQIIEDKIFSYPMKGTIDANIFDAKNKLLNDEKELSEHFTIVDLIRNDLNIVAKNVTVEKFRYIDQIKNNNKNLLQTSSRISGSLESNYYSKIGDILFALLPAGSISGAPKKKTVEIIKEAENYKRGYYTGIAGVFDGKNLDSCVMIRFIEKKKKGLFYKSGGGVTAMSDVSKEFEELLDKIYIPIK